MNRRTGSLLVVLAAVLWGTTGTAQALAPAGASPVSVGSLRLLIGGAALLFFALARHDVPPLRDWPLPMILLTAGFVAVYQLCFFAAVDRTGVVIGTIVGIGSAPVMAGILSWALVHERPGARWTVATLLAISGCALLMLLRGEIALDLAGILLALGAGLSYALYTLTSKRLLETLPPDAVMGIVFSIGALLLLPLLFGADLRWVRVGSGLWVVLHLGLIATGLSYILFARGLRQVPAARAVSLSLAEPLTAGLLGILLVGERLTLPALLGIALLLSGLIWLAFG